MLLDIMGAQEATSTGKSVEIELRVRDRECFFVRASEEADCRVALEDLVHRADGQLIEFFTIRGVSADHVLSMAADEPAITEARLIKDGPDGSLFQFIVAGPCVTATLANTGAITRAVSASSGEGRVIADVPPHAEVRTVVETFGQRHSDSELLARRERERAIPIRTEQGVHAALADRLTDKQLEAIKTAYLSGYFDWPRESTADECAEALGISQPTFSQHVRAAQHAVFATVFGAELPER